MTSARQHFSAQAFPRQARLVNGAQFQSVFKQAAYRSSDRGLTVLARPNDATQARLGLAIGKRCAKSAVDRNRIKRLVRESFRHFQSELAGLDVVVLGKEAANHTSNPDLREALKRHWQRVARQCASC